MNLPTAEPFTATNGSLLVNHSGWLFRLRRLVRTDTAIRWSRPLTVGFVAFGVAYALSIAAGRMPYPGDAQTYYLAHGEPLYGFAWWSGPGYSYSPAFAQLLTPLQLLSWAAFAVLWETMLFAMLAYVLRAWAWLVLVGGIVGIICPPLRFLAWPLSDLAMGNIQTVFALVALVGFRHSWAWAFMLLTKVTPAVGLAYFLGARQWRKLVVPIALAAGISGISFLAAPHLWFEWFGLLTSKYTNSFAGFAFPVPLPVRFAMSFALAYWGGRTERRWTVPIAAGWALPVAYGTLTMIWLAAIPLLNEVRPNGVHIRARGQSVEGARESEPSTARGVVLI